MSSFLLRRALPTSSRVFSTSTVRPLGTFARMTIIGHLVDTPEISATSTGHDLLKYSVGVNTGYKDNQKASFFRIASFMPEGSQRDFISSLDKGTLVHVEGNVSMEPYQDSEGKNRTSLNIIQRSLTVLSPKKSE
ncbi:hypothetical protein B7494_g6504 [Chlorociboria aeruginascens]|nr:hypothetical protein B7494_g6504 [Chlorociboria aeruginascens]